MRKISVLIPLLAVCFAIPARAQNYKNAGDFTNTFEINIRKDDSGLMEKCQAVRLSKNWFITAAHCISPVCDNSCIIQARLLIKNGYEMDLETIHSSSRAAVFKHERNSLNKNESGYDIALINFAPDSSKYIYKNLEQHILIPKEDFDKQVKFTNSEYSQAVEGTNYPELLELKAKEPKLLARNISVVSIWDGQRDVLSSSDFVIFSPKKNYVYTPNFGIRQGLSGSGLMTDKGELVGIISSNADLTRSYQESGGTGKTEKLFNLSFIAAFDEYAINFIRRNTGNVNYTVSNSGVLKDIPPEYTKMAEQIDDMLN